MGAGGLGDRFADALGYAFALHRDQGRHGTVEPAVAHLMAVSARVLQAGADEDVAIAALLHDAAEDHGGAARLEDIRARFGPSVARAVAACTDDPEEADWRRRKERSLDHLEHAAEPALLIVAADKLDNVRAMIRDYEANGPAIWARWKGEPEARLWYYRATLDLLRRRLGTTPLVLELQREVERMERTVAR